MAWFLVVSLCRLSFHRHSRIANGLFLLLSHGACRDCLVCTVRCATASGRWPPQLSCHDCSSTAAVVGGIALFARWWNSGTPPRPPPPQQPTFPSHWNQPLHSSHYVSSSAVAASYRPAAVVRRNFERDGFVNSDSEEVVVIAAPARLSSSGSCCFRTCAQVLED